MRVWFQNKSIFKKLLMTFALVVIIPQAVSYYIAQRTTSNLIIYQNIAETVNSLTLVANSIDSLLQRAYSMALYVNSNENIGQMLQEASSDASNIYALNPQALQLRKLERINQFNRIINNLAFNMIEVRSYITIVAEGQMFINWTNTGEFSEKYLENKHSNRIWFGFEPNYVSIDNRNLPYVWTIGKNIMDPVNNTWQGAFLISIPERSVSDLLSADDTQTRFILDENNNIIASTDPELLGENFNKIYDNEAMIVSQVPLRNWYIVDIKYYDSLINLLNVSRLNLLMLNVLSIGTFVFIAGFIARGISKPLEKRFMTDAKAKREAELKALQAQISPHFLFNTLNSIRWAAFNNNNKKAGDMTFALSNLLRMTIVNGEEFITLETEVENLHYYVNIFKLSQAIDFSFIAEISEELKSYPIPKLLLQPVVENSLIHGFNEDTENGVIIVKAEKLINEICISIEDNGTGMDINKTIKKGQKFSGIGVDNVNERIKMNFGSEYGLKIESEIGKGTVVKLMLPLNM